MAAKKKNTTTESKISFLIEKGKEFSLDLIKRATPWEKEFMKKLENTEIPFIFQYPVICAKHKLFIIDFYIPKYKLAIELDGQAHYTPSGIKYDKRRTGCLKREGIRVTRIMNKLVKEITPTHIKDLILSYGNI